MMFAYGFMFTFITFTAFLAFSPSANSSISPLFTSIFSSSSSSSSSSHSSYDSNTTTQFSSLFNFFFPNSSTNNPTGSSTTIPVNQTVNVPQPNSNQTASKSLSTEPHLNQTLITPPSTEFQLNQTLNAPQPSSNQTSSESPSIEPHLNQTFTPPKPPNSTETHLNITENRLSNLTASLLKQSNGETKEAKKKKKRSEEDMGSLMHCDIFDGKWVRDDSYPLYAPGSCPHIDESFNCFRNGRPDGDFQKLRWQPNGCNLPRLNGRDMLELLRGKRLVFVGDSLNRNMWESLVCILRNSVRDKRKVFEASGRREFRTENSYLFVFKDYNCTVEFFRSPFLVQEWEMPDTNGSKKETLRLDLVERSSSKYKTADIIVFNTGHWWTHEKTSKGKDYYQEGNRVYNELNVVEAFRKALMTWAKWVDVNVDPNKSLVFFRGYSASHFSGGQWNSGGQCDDETEPIKNETYLSVYPPKMRVLESVLKGMKMPVSYLNITRMTDYRKDAHPSVYRKLNLSEEERRSPLRYQDCSHWCLPGVPDAWNELLYAKLFVELNQKQQQQQQQQSNTGKVKSKA